ncbi:hypothetical protein PsYK624_055840 [Phanerochaete sordida]|uniref:Uncharacterized protein n=1 Tax=Phanerochaete sordida TaxID=48140 RepID=A0A9P3G720_9APHY|nr:hypothetical protein PsYK624_055840 [Phanerochaete sordida]
MPKGPKYVCATCGKWERISLKEHHKKVHQKECTVQFKGQPGRVTCQRDLDGLWRCPRCGMEFEGTPRKLQTHGLKGECITVPGDVNTPVPLEQPAPPSEQDDNKQQQPTVIVPKEEPEVQDDEDPDAQDDEEPEAQDDEEPEVQHGEAAPAGDTVVFLDDILGNYINELDDEAAFIKHLLEEDARDTQDVEIKLDMDSAPSWERELLQPGTSTAMKSEEQYGVSNNSTIFSAAIPTYFDPPPIWLA